MKGKGKKTDHAAAPKGTARPRPRTRKAASDQAGAKATEAQAARRVEELLRIRLDGAELWDVREYVREKVAAKDPVWGSRLLSDSQIYRYLQRVDELIAESCKVGRKRLFRRHLAQRRALYARALQTGELRTALAVLRDEATLEGLYPPQKIAPTNPQGDAPYEPGTLTDAERAAALDRLYASLGPGTGSAAAGQPAGAAGSLLG